MKDIFISYSSTDKEIAEDIADTLSRNGWDCFMAHRDIHAGEEYAERIVDAIDHAQMVVLIMSKMANDSQHVMREVERAVSCNLPIIVYFLEEVTLSKSMEYFVKTQQWIWPDTFQKEKLLCGVQGILTKKQAENDISRSENVTGKLAKASENKKTGISMIVMLGIIIILVVIIAVLFLGRQVDENVAKEDISAESEMRFADVSLGDEVTLGTYRGENIVWRVLHINEDGTAVLIAKDCICVKAFDAAECGTFNEYEDVDYWLSDNYLVEDPKLNSIIRGNNDWSLSNIRTWLNSDSEVVEYIDQAPTRAAVCEGANYYDDESGFLHDWSDTDKAELVLSTVRTPANEITNNSDTYGYVETKDYVFLLSEKEMTWFAEAGFKMYAGLIDVAYDQDNTSHISSFQEYCDTDTVSWWLRDPVLTVPEGAGTRVLVVPMKNMLAEDELLTSDDVAALGVYGVRPAVTIRIK